MDHLHLSKKEGLQKELVKQEINLQLYLILINDADITINHAYM